MSRAARRADRLDAALLTRLEATGTGEAEVAPPAGRALLAVLALGYYLLVATVLVAGIVLVVRHAGAGAVLMGLLLLAIAVFLRPRFGRAPRVDLRLTRERCPQLIELVERIARETGTAPPGVIALTLGPELVLRRSGIRGRTTLVLGGIGWLSLSGQQRVAALSHELAHRDIGALRWAAPMTTALARAVSVTRGDRSAAELFGPLRRRVRTVTFVGIVLAWLLGRALRAAQVGVGLLGVPARFERAYRADDRAADIAGTPAAVAVLERAAHADDIARLIHHSAMHRPPEQWCASIDAFLTAHAADDLPAAGSRADPCAAHPPAARRLHLQHVRPLRRPRVVLTTAGARAIDVALQSWITATHAEALGTRDFVQRRAAPRRIPST